LSSASKKTETEAEDLLKEREILDSDRQRDKKQDACAEVVSKNSADVPRAPVQRQNSDGPPRAAAAVVQAPATSASKLPQNRQDTEEDAQSVSTVSGSGIDFFRKFVQRKGSGCKECEDQFRREVLIDRLVADSLHSKAVLAAGSSARSARTNSNSGHC
jgi:hypothetical protein